jgi:hypothetical protein
MVNGKYHRIGGPAYLYWRSNVLAGEGWYIDGTLHREDGAAMTDWHDNGVKVLEEWYFEGMLHRLDGPAKREWNENGREKVCEWYKHGKKLHIPY